MRLSLPPDVIATLDKDFMTHAGSYYKWRGHHAGEVFKMNYKLLAIGRVDV